MLVKNRGPLLVKTDSWTDLQLVSPIVNDAGFRTKTKRALGDSNTRPLDS